jgi:hypothetical protein
MKRLMLIALLLLSLTISAQETTTTSTAAPATTTTAAVVESTTSMNSEELRGQFTTLLSRSPSELATILLLDPTLLSDAAFLARYPHLAKFVAEHPEVRHNPRYYLGDFRLPGERGNGVLADFLQGLIIFATFLLIAFAFAWLVRTLIEQKRWSRLADTQSEVHKKIMDRFGTSAELMEYIGTPAGSKFLQSAPIPLHADSAPQNAPLARVLWSIQIGVIVAAAAIGMLIVSGRYADETGQTLFALGVIALCIGGGFIVSAALSMFLSRRLTANADANA